MSRTLENTQHPGAVLQGSLRQSSSGQLWPFLQMVFSCTVERTGLGDLGQEGLFVSYGGLRSGGSVP